MAGLISEFDDEIAYQKALRRERIATAAMQAIIVNPQTWATCTGYKGKILKSGQEAIAMAALMQADALIEGLDRDEGLKK